MTTALRNMVSLLLAAAVSSAVACSAPSSDGPAPVPPASPSPSVQRRTPIDLPKLEKQVHDRVNKERARRGLPTMRWDDALCRIARSHSKDMAKRNYFGHTSPDGRSYAQRYLQAGYACGVTVNGVLHRGGENISRLAPEGSEDLAAAALRAWTTKSEDRKNLFSSPWERQGIGIWMGPDGILYITLNFC